MKALFLSNDASIPDIASATRIRMQGYADEIGELHVLLHSNRDRTTTDGSITIHEVRTSKYLAPFVLPKRARSLIRKYGIDVVSTQDPFEHGLVGVFAVRGTDARLHVQLHTDFLSPWFTHGYSRLSFLNHIRTWIASYVLRRADGIRVVAPRLKRSLMARYGARIKEPSVIPVLVLDEESAHEDLAAPFPITLLVLGRLEPEKRFQDAIRALALLRKKYPDAGLIIAGEGSERQRLRNEAKALGLEGWVRFLGMRADVAQLLQASHVMVMTSAYEGYSRTLIESARARLPIVTTDVGVVGDVLKPNIHVLTANIADPVSLAASIERLVDDTELRDTLVQAAKDAVTKHLSAYENQSVMIAHDLRDTVNAEI